MRSKTSLSRCGSTTAAPSHVGLLCRVHAPTSEERAPVRGEPVRPWKDNNETSRLTEQQRLNIQQLRKIRAYEVHKRHLSGVQNDERSLPHGAATAQSIGLSLICVREGAGCCTVLYAQGYLM